MAKITIDGAELCGTHTGMHRFIVQVLLAADKYLDDYKGQVEVVYPFYKRINIPKMNNIKVHSIITLPRLYRKMFLPFYLVVNRSVYCGLANNMPIGKKNIICLHDINPSKPEAGFSEDERKKRLEVLYPQIARKAQTILTVSETSKEDIINTLKISSKRVVVIYNGCEHMADIKTDDNIFIKYPDIVRGKYIYALGSIMPHKNYEWIVQVAKNNPKYQFVIAGKMHQLGSDDIDKISNIIYVGYVTDEENKSLMTECKLFVQPSKLEGFGIPPLEALTCGAKVAVAKASCLPEIYMNCVAYFDPDDYDVSIDSLVDEKRESPEKLFDKYSWQKSGKKLAEIFKEACEEN